MRCWCCYLFFAKNALGTEFIGLDYSKELVDLATEIARKKSAYNLRFEVDDWYNLRSNKEIDGIISLQTLSWLPDFKLPLKELFEKISPSWIGLTSLFYDGEISCKIEVEEHLKEKKCFYNVYSLSEIGRFCKQYNYKIARISPFIINIDIPKPITSDFMATYTVAYKEIDEDTIKRLQISGPLLMNWYEILIEKI